MADAAPKKDAPAGAEDDAPDRRRHHRADLPLKARFLTEAGEEREALVTNISAGGAMLQAKFPPPPNQKLIIYVDQLGRIEAHVVRKEAGAFAVRFSQSRTKQNKIADHLTSVLNQRRSGAERRVNPRIRHDSAAVVRLEDGRVSKCSILDISLTGASIEITPRPPLGARLILGRMKAKVIRRHEKGVAVVFTGAVERMDKAIEETTVNDLAEAPGGANVAGSFGKKGVSA